MKLKPKFIQFDCIEGDRTDLRQSNAILFYKPDIIIFETPQDIHGPNVITNRYSCAKKPIERVDKIIKGLKKEAKRYLYAASDIIVWENIKKMWKLGINTQIYNVDSPTRLRREFSLFKKPNSVGYPAVRKYWLFWVYLYLRDSYMAKNIKIVLDTYSQKEDPTILIFLQSIHWKHVKFLLTNPSKEEIWKYYFGKFNNLKPNSDMENKIKDRSKVLNYYWVKNQKFY